MARPAPRRSKRGSANPNLHPETAPRRLLPARPRRPAHRQLPPRRSRRLAAHISLCCGQGTMSCNNCNSARFSQTVVSSDQGLQTRAHGPLNSAKSWSEHQRPAHDAPAGYPRRSSGLRVARQPQWHPTGRTEPDQTPCSRHVVRSSDSGAIRQSRFCATDEVFCPPNFEPARCWARFGVGPELPDQARR